MRCVDVNILVHAHRGEVSLDEEYSADRSFARYPALRWRHPFGS